MASFPQGKSVEDMQAAFDSTPLFMNSISPGDEEDNATLQALQSLIYSDDPTETASNFKSQGNEWFAQQPASKKNFKEALTYYTRGLAAACPDKSLNSLLYSNRAAVHLRLENYGSALRDCKSALLIDPEMEKAWFRAAKACLKTFKIVEAQDCIQRGLAVCYFYVYNKKVNPENESLLSIEVECQEAIVNLDILNAKTKAREDEVKRVERDLLSNLVDRKAQFLDADGKSVVSPPSFRHPYSGEHRVKQDESGLLLWPVMMMYPEHQESDFIAEFCEGNSFRDQLEVIMSFPAPWDQEERYTVDTVSVYFISKNQNDVGLIPLDMTLQELISHEMFCILDGVVSIYVVVKGSEFEEKFSKQFREKRVKDIN
jgi:tetratricopeptide (TPR) repeat protein